MSAWQNFLNWLAGDGSKNYVIEKVSSSTDADATLDIKLLMMSSAMGYLASSLAMCSWRTIVGGEEEHGQEYFRLNNRPNKNQNKAQFCAKLVYKLCMENEALVFSPNGSDFYVADSWNVEDRGTQENIYRNVCLENDQKSYDYYSRDVWHLKMNWIGLWPLLSGVADEYETMISTAYSGYRRQSGMKGIINISSAPSGTKEQKDNMIKNLQARLKSFYGDASSALVLHNGYSYTPVSASARNTSEINDVAALTDEFAERLGLAIRVPAALLKGDVENTEHAKADLITFGVKPLAQMIEQEYNTKRLGAKKVASGSRLFIDPLPIQLGDVANLPVFCERMTSCGQYSVDELRELRGEPTLGTPDAQLHYITKNYGALSQATENTNQAPSDNQTDEGGDNK